MFIFIIFLFLEIGKNDYNLRLNTPKFYFRPLRNNGVVNGFKLKFNANPIV